MTCPTMAGTVGSDTATTQLVAAGSCDNDDSDVVETMASPADTGFCEDVDVNESLQLSDAGSGADPRQTLKMPYADAAFSVDATTDEWIGDVAVAPSPPPPGRFRMSAIRLSLPGR